MEQEALTIKYYIENGYTLQYFCIKNPFYRSNVIEKLEFGILCGVNYNLHKNETKYIKSFEMDLLISSTNKSKD